MDTEKHCKSAERMSTRKGKRLKGKKTREAHAASPSKKAGRPSIRSPETATKICTLLAEGMSLRAICKMDGLPDKTTVLRWLADDSEFCTQYARAREAQADEMADELLEIADDGTNDWMLRQGKDGADAWAVNGEHIQRSRLRVDARKWLMSKLRPKKYGDRIDLAHGGPNGGPIPLSLPLEFVAPRK
jgi:hypothetical protein